MLMSSFGRLSRAWLLALAIAAIAGLSFAAAASAIEVTKWEAGTCANIECKDSDVNEGHSSFFYTQAAGHPNFGITDFRFATHEEGILKAQVPDEHVKDVRVDLPPGLAVNPEATEAKCTEEELNKDEKLCPEASQVGVDQATGTATVLAKLTIEEEFPVYNMVRKPGQPARFGVEINSPKIKTAGLQGHIYLEGGISWHKEAATPENSGVATGDYHEYFEIKEIAEEPEVVESRLVFWGIPQEEQKAPTEKPKAFITLPSTCAEKPITYLHADSYEAPGNWTPLANQAPVTATGCGSLAFTPSLSLLPKSTQSDQPDGATTSLHVPQTTNEPAKPNSPDVETAVVTLPEGMTLNPAAAHGLLGCGNGEFAAGACPTASQVGSFTVNAPGIPPGRSKAASTWDRQKPARARNRVACTGSSSSENRLSTASACTWKAASAPTPPLVA